MRTRPILIVATVVGLCAALPFGLPGAAVGDPPTPIYQNTSYSFAERASDIVARLTPAQRAAQLVSSQAPQVTSVTNPLLPPTQIGGQTTLAGPASAGDTTIKVASVTNMVAGMPLALDPAGPGETVTIATVGTAAAAATTLPVGASAGDANIKVASIAGMTVGHSVRIDTGASIEFGTVSTVGTAALTATTLAAASAAGDTNIKVASVTNMIAGHQIRVDTGANLEVRTIQTVGTSGAAGTGITLTSPLTIAHASGAGAQDMGTGVTLGAPLTLEHAANAAAQDLGSGVALTAPLAGAHAFGAGLNLLVGIPRYGWWNEALHGVSRESTAATGNAITLTNTTSYPIDQSIGASWDPELLYRVASAISDEAREVTTFNKLDLDYYSPTMNMQHDPRWGRNDEAYGEDPLLVTKMVSQFVNGMEGKDMNGNLLPDGSGYYKTTTTLKHYAMNNSEVNRRAGSADTDDRTIREFYTEAFRDVVQATQPGSIMSSYNSVNGVPTAADPYLIDTLMRQTFGFQGYFTGDCDAISAGINPQHHWQPAGFPHQVTVIESLAFALGAGEDAECNAGFTNASNYRGPTAASTTAGGTMNAIGMHITTGTGEHTVNDLDVSAARLFTNRMKLGEFDADSSVPWVVQARSRVAPGTWTNNDANLAVTETASRLALAREAGDKSIVLLKNATTTRKDGSTGKLLPIAVPPTGTFKVLVVGFYANNANFYLGGYSSTQGTNGQAKEVNFYPGIRAAIQAVNPGAQVDFQRGFTGTGTNAGNCCGTIDPAAVTAAAGYDYVIAVAGMDQAASSGTTGVEDRDRTAMTLPGLQGQLIAQLAAANPNTVAYMETIGPQDVTSFEPSTSAILWSSYNGQRKGESLADVLLGAYNPSGRTNGIWYQTNAQIPAITNYAIRPASATGRTYMYYNGPLSYPFGYGLSYSSFSYANLQLDSHSLDANDTLHASVDVTNGSTRAGSEIVEVYVSTPDADAALERPLKRLEGFQKVALDPGQTKTVTFAIKVPDLAFYDDAADKWAVDNGHYGIQISKSSADADVQVQDVVTVSGAIAPKPSVVTAKPRISGTDLDRGISQRVMFPEGVVVDPGLTVAMNDDTLYGFIEPGKGVPFPAGMTLTYSSNRPAVVSVDGGGVIHTVANGAATVTATASYGGVSKSTSFVVRVLSELGSLKVNGKALTGFNADVTNYDVTVPAGVSAVPQVTATAPSGTVAITQATSLPGVATVTSTGPEGIVTTYTVNFAKASVSDDFASATLGPKWSIVREVAADWSLTSTPGSLVITPKTGDLTTTTNTAANVFLQPALGDWDMSTKVTFSARPNAATQQGGIIAYGNDDNYLKFDLEATSATNIQFSTSLEDTLNGVQVNQTLNTLNANSILGADNTIWLRMTKSGSVYSTFYSVDGTTWVPVWTTGATLKNVKAGVFAFNRAGTTTALQAAFDYFNIAGSAPTPTTAPVTTAVVTPTPVSGWNRVSPVTVTLTAVDNSGWGIASSEYKVDSADWALYTAPFPVSGEGVHTVLYRSTDNAGNVEVAKTLTVKIDLTAPTTTATLTPTAIGAWYSPRAVVLTATDGVGSGVASTSYRVDGGAWTTYTGPFAITTFGPHTLDYASTDVAGNVETTKSVSWGSDFTAADQLQGLSDFVGGLGLDKGLTKDLQKKLEEAGKKLDKPKDACNQLNDFIKQVVDQAGKKDPKLTVEQAEQLLSVYQIETLLGCVPVGSPNPAAEVALLELGATIDGMGLDKPAADDLGNRVKEAGKQLADQKLDATCKQLGDLSKKIDEFAGGKNPKLTAAQAAELKGDVTEISTLLGC